MVYTAIWTIAGIRNARVLPEPVYAIPIISLPLRAIVKAIIFNIILYLKIRWLLEQ